MQIDFDRLQPLGLILSFTFEGHAFDLKYDFYCKKIVYSGITLSVYFLSRTDNHSLLSGFRMDFRNCRIISMDMEFERRDHQDGILVIGLHRDRIENGE